MNHSKDLVVEMIETTLGILFDPNTDYDEKRDVLKWELK